ncbi:hypothetical protein [Clostridium butyricum]|uniref:hypothetical protein n=1 Tax=Clostridium butyricum TaxID=1492 RepID=UPI0028FD453D|nr:hypothetical protein [Clostridium butyricum]MDU0323854.1 hypothetical protein [Clostridium butyricum]
MEENLVNEYGIFTPNKVTNQTAEEVYREWLENKNNPPKTEPTEIELLNKQLLETQATLAEMQYNNLLKENGGI